MVGIVAVMVAGFIISAALFGLWCAIAKTVYDFFIKKR